MPVPGPEVLRPGRRGRLLRPDAEITAGLRKLAEASVLAVVGPSGCGKSSLVRAGVAATLRRDRDRVVAITPGLHPVAVLAAALPGEGRTPTLLVDQCEEVFSLCQDATERQTFLTRLAAHASKAPLILSLRADRLADLSAHPEFARAVERGLHLLTSMSDEELRTAITEPARLASLVVEPGLVDLLVAEVAGQPGALPLMSHALAETWQRREGRLLTIAGYHASGGIQGAVAQSAEQVYAQVGSAQQPMLRELLLRLVTPGPDGQPVRSRLPRRTVITGPESEALIELLVGSRLVTSDDGVIELAHEALARAWPRLRGWLEEDLEGQQILHHLTTVADSWDSLGRPESELYRGVRLAKAVEWRDSARPTLTRIERDFLAASEDLSATELHAAESQARRQLRVNRRLRAALGTAAFLLVGALIAGFLAVGQAKRADRQSIAAGQAALVADAGRAGAKAVGQTDIDTSLLFAVAGLRMDVSPESRANLLASLAKHPQLIRSIQTERLDVYGMEVSADGRRAILYDASGAALLYELSTGTLLAEHRPPSQTSGAFHQDWLAPIALARGDRQLAIAMPPPTTEPVRLLDPATLLSIGQQLPGFTTVPARAIHLDYSHDGNSLVAMVQFYGDGVTTDPSGGAVLVWDVRPGRPPALRMRLPLPGSTVQDVVISPAGDRIYTSNPLTAYEVPSGHRIYQQPERLFVDADLSPDGKTLVLDWESTDEAGVDFDDVLLVDAATGTTKSRLSRHTAQLLSARFSHDGTVLVSVGTDQRVVLWQVSSGKPLDEIQVAEGDSLGAAFSPDDKTLYTAGGDGAVRTWDLDGRRRYMKQLAKPVGFSWGCRYVAPGGRIIERGVEGEDGFIGLDGKVILVKAASSDTGTNSCGTWHPDGETFATAGGDSVVRVWEARTGRLVASRKAAEGLILDLDYSGRDGSRIVIGEASGLVTLLDSSTLEPVGKPIDVGAPVPWLSASPDNRTALVLTGGRPISFGSFGLDVPSTGWALVDLVTSSVIRRGEFTMPAPEVVSFAPDGRHVAIGSSRGHVLILDTDTGKAVRAPQLVSEGLTNGLAFSADSSLLVSSGFDGSVSLFDGRTAALLGTVTLPSHQMTSADFRSDGHTVVIASYDDGIYSWDTSLESAIETACNMAGRDLTIQEWQETFGSRPYQETCPKR